MSWQSLLSSPDDTVIAPWMGGRVLRHHGRVWNLQGRGPNEHGWHRFGVTGGRKATWKGPAEHVDVETYFADARAVHGYAVGDRIVPDGIPYVADIAKILDYSKPVHFLEPGLDRFSRITAATHDDGSLVYVRTEFPQGSESSVLDAFLNRTSIDTLSGVTPSLNLAFRFEVWQREQAEIHRQALLAARREEERRRALEEQRKALVERLGDGASRRAMALIDFGEAATAALAVTGAVLLDWRDAVRDEPPQRYHGPPARGARRAPEAVVRFRFRERRFECVVDKHTLRIVDSGVCLVGNDTLFTLESLPGVIGEAMDTHRLHVFRHADNLGNDWHDDHDEEDD